eukprot:TRINITY_DN3577_c1_g1_i1.p3 TRINITY_DN3577_c1_g1~~TRINITY_DN3577_c1_g1_i1.p3  ORF type:complete len:141 (+),score=5.59 TRINITY_DN3577_c1_g1_i1:240-662(+)
MALKMKQRMTDEKMICVIDCQRTECVKIPPLKVSYRPRDDCQSETYQLGQPNLLEQRNLTTIDLKRYAHLFANPSTVQELTVSMTTNSKRKDGRRRSQTIVLVGSGEMPQPHHIKQIPYQQFHIHINTTFGMAVEHIMLL